MAEDQAPDKTITPAPGYPDPIGLMVAVLQDSTEEWRGELPADLPPEVLTWPIRPDGQTMGAVILHMIVAELAWTEGFLLNQPVSQEDKAILLWDEIDVDDSRWPIPPAQPLTWYYALQDQYRNRTLESMKHWPDPHSMIQGPRRKLSPIWVLGHLIQHDAYHGGQLALIHDHYEKLNA